MFVLALFVSTNATRACVDPLKLRAQTQGVLVLPNSPGTNTFLPVLNRTLEAQAAPLRISAERFPAHIQRLCDLCDCQILFMHVVTLALVATNKNMCLNRSLQADGYSLKHQRVANLNGQKSHYANQRSTAAKRVAASRRYDLVRPGSASRREIRLPLSG